MHVFEVGKKDVLSANESEGSTENPKGGSSSTPVVKLNIRPRVTVCLLPAALETKMT